ncbi:MAG: PAS domain-containing protein [Thermodesulfovibrionales bacterium]
MIDCAGDAIFIVNLADNRIVDCNRQASLALGYSREELLQLLTTDIEVELSADEVQAVHANISFGVTSNVQGMHRRKNGTVFPVDIRLALLGPPGSNLSIAIVRDISEMRKAEEALLESERAFHNLFNNSEIAMFRTRIDGSEMLNVNEKFLELVGRTRDEVIGKPSVIF